MAMYKSLHSERNSSLNVSQLEKKWQRVLEDERRSYTRNKKLLEDFDSVEQQINLFARKSDSLRHAKHAFESYVSAVYPKWKKELKKWQEAKVKKSEKTLTNEQEDFSHTKSLSSSGHIASQAKPVSSSTPYTYRGENYQKASPFPNSGRNRELDQNGGPFPYPQHLHQNHYPRFGLDHLGDRQWSYHPDGYNQSGVYGGYVPRYPGFPQQYNVPPPWAASPYPGHSGYMLGSYAGQYHGGTMGNQDHSQDSVAYFDGSGNGQRMDRSPGFEHRERFDHQDVERRPAGESFSKEAIQREDERLDHSRRPPHKSLSSSQERLEITTNYDNAIDHLKDMVENGQINERSRTEFAQPVHQPNDDKDIAKNIKPKRDGNGRAAEGRHDERTDHFSVSRPNSDKATKSQNSGDHENGRTIDGRHDERTDLFSSSRPNSGKATKSRKPENQRPVKKLDLDSASDSMVGMFAKAGRTHAKKENALSSPSDARKVQLDQFSSGEDSIESSPSVNLRTTDISSELKTDEKDIYKIASDSISLPTIHHFEGDLKDFYSTDTDQVSDLRSPGARSASGEDGTRRTEPQVGREVRSMANDLHGKELDMKELEGKQLDQKGLDGRGLERKELDRKESGEKAGSGVEVAKKNRESLMDELLGDDVSDFEVSGLEDSGDESDVSDDGGSDGHGNGLFDSNGLDRSGVLGVGGNGGSHSDIRLGHGHDGNGIGDSHDVVIGGGGSGVSGRHSLDGVIGGSHSDDGRGPGGSDVAGVRGELGNDGVSGKSGDEVHHIDTEVPSKNIVSKQPTTSPISDKGQIKLPYDEANREATSRNSSPEESPIKTPTSTNLSPVSNQGSPLGNEQSTTPPGQLSQDQSLSPKEVSDRPGQRQAESEENEVIVVDEDSLLSLLQVVDDDIEVSFSTELLYRHDHCTSEQKLEVLKASKSTGETFAKFDPAVITMVILDQLPNLVRSSGKACLVSDEILANDKKYLHEENFRTQIDKSLIVLWTKLFRHFDKMIQYDVMNAQQISKIFAPRLVSSKCSSVEKAVRLLAKILTNSQDEDGQSINENSALDESSSSGEVELSSPKDKNDRNASDVQSGAKDNLSYSEDFEEDNKSIPLTETDAYQKMLSSMKVSEDEDEEDIVEDLLGETISEANTSGPLKQSYNAGQQPGGGELNNKASNKPKGPRLSMFNSSGEVDEFDENSLNKDGLGSSWKSSEVSLSPPLSPTLDQGGYVPSAIGRKAGNVGVNKKVEKSDVKSGKQKPDTKARIQAGFWNQSDSEPEVDLQVSHGADNNDDDDFDFYS